MPPQTENKLWDQGLYNTWQTCIFRFRNVFFNFPFLAMNSWEDSIKRGGSLSVWSALENTQGRSSHQSFSLIYSWFKHIFCLGLQSNLGQVREKPMHVFFFSTPLCVSSPSLLLETQIWPTLPTLCINKLKTHYKYFTLILNAVSISLNQSSKRDYKTLLHQIIMRSSKQHHKYCLKQTKNLETRTFLKLVSTT